MTNKITLAVILSILILGTFVQRTMAPDEEPQKLGLGGTGYNDETGNFELQVSSEWKAVGVVGDRANFQITATLVISDASGPVDTVTGSSPVRIAGEPAPGSRAVPLEDALVAWDRLGGTYTGIVDVETTASLTKDGHPVANSETSRTDSGIVIGGGSPAAGAQPMGGACPDCQAVPDGTVGVPDLLALLSQWGACINCSCDLDGCGCVSVPDLLQLLAAWGNQCP